MHLYIYTGIYNANNLQFEVFIRHVQFTVT